MPPRVRFFCVAITTKFAIPPSCDEVLLPYANRGSGNRASGLNEKCVAKCTWIVKIKADDIEKVLGRLPVSCVNEIVSKAQIAYDEKDPSEAKRDDTDTD